MASPLEETKAERDEALRNAKGFMNAPQGERYMMMALIHQLETVRLTLEDIGYLVQDLTER